MGMEELTLLFSKIWVVWLTFVFLAVLAYAYWPKNKDRFAADAMIPLNDDDMHEEG